MRRYSNTKPLPPTPLRSVPAPQPIELGELKAWEDGKILHDLKEASRILTAKLGSGYSYHEMRQAIATGEWQEKVHYWRKGRRFKVSVWRIINWQLG